MLSNARCYAGLDKRMAVYSQMPGRIKGSERVDAEMVALLCAILACIAVARAILEACIVRLELDQRRRWQT